MELYWPHSPKGSKLYAEESSRLEFLREPQTCLSKADLVEGGGVSLGKRRLKTIRKSWSEIMNGIETHCGRPLLHLRRHGTISQASHAIGNVHKLTPISYWAKKLAFFKRNILLKNYLATQTASHRRLTCFGVDSPVLTHSSLTQGRGVQWSDSTSTAVYTASAIRDSPSAPISTDEQRTVRSLEPRGMFELMLWS